MVQKHKLKISSEDIINLYNSNKTLHEAAVELNMTTVTLWRRAKDLGLMWSKRKTKRKSPRKIELIAILEGNHPEYQTFKLKNRLIEEGIKENKCECCGITEWNDIPISMQLDHIDGDSHNHLLSNLRMLCPNCHSQTPTFSGKKRKK